MGKNKHPKQLVKDISISVNTTPTKLTNHARSPFKVCIDHRLCNNYSFKDMNHSDIKEFDSFLEMTIGRGLTITEVENAFLRDGPKRILNIKNIDRKVIHFGKNEKLFRIHGYYNNEGYFVIYQIDPKHTVHKK